jgi:hypothetical protein
MVPSGESTRCHTPARGREGWRRQRQGLQVSSPRGLLEREVTPKQAVAPLKQEADDEIGLFCCLMTKDDDDNGAAPRMRDRSLGAKHHTMQILTTER